MLPYRLLLSLPVLLNTFWCGSDKDPVPYTEYVVLKHEQTLNEQLQHPRTRWILERVPQDSVLGFGNKKYAQIKTFDLLDTMTYYPGYHFLLDGYVVEPTRQTSWQTQAEWLSGSASSAGYVAYPELLINNKKPL